MSSIDKYLVMTLNAYHYILEEAIESLNLANLTNHS